MGFWRRIVLRLGFAGAIAGSTSQQTIAQQTTQQEQRDDYPTRLNRMMQVEGIRNPGMYTNFSGYAMLQNTKNLVQEISLNLFRNADLNNTLLVIKYLHGDEQKGVLMRDAREVFRLSSPNASTKEAIDALRSAVLHQH